jgi:predicted permease
VALAAPPGDRPYLLDDLEEEFRDRAAVSLRRARRWYRRQALASLAPLAGRRLSLALGRIRPTLALDATFQDLRYAVRTGLARPAFTLVAVTTIALAVGANTAIFSLVEGALLRPPPGMGDTRGLVEISRNLEGRFFDVSYPVYRRIASDVEGLESVAAFNLEPVSVGAPGAEPRAVVGLSVTASYFDVLALRPRLGRFFAAVEATPPTAAAVAVLSEHLWRDRLREDPDIVGRRFIVNGAPVTVLGVGPPGFRGHARVPTDVFLPLGAEIPGLSSPEVLAGAGNGVVEMLGRLRPGASPEAVEVQATAAGDAALRAGTQAEAGTFRAQAHEWGPIPAVARTPVTVFLALLMAVVGVVLVVACVNVAGMFLSRSVQRRSEIAVRRAIGATRSRIARQLLTESLLLFLVGGAAGVLLSAWLVRLLLALEPPLPQGFEVGLDLGLNGRVLAFALTLTVATAVAFNVLPALGATRLEPRDGLGAGRTHTGGRHRIRSLLVAGQMAGSVTLLVVAGLFLRSLSGLGTVETGWEAEGVLTADVDLTLLGMGEEEGRAAFQAVLDRVAALPGARSAALAAKAPLSGRSSLGLLNAAGVEPPPGRNGFEVAMNRVSPGYFGTLAVDVLEGRTFGPDAARNGARVAVVNERLAGLLWPGRSAVGGRFWAGPVGSDLGFTVVGVVENTAVGELSGVAEPFYYLPAEQWYNSSMSLFVRARPGDRTELAAAVGATLRTLLPNLPPPEVRPFTERLALFQLPQRLAAWVTGVVGLLGLALATVGAYGLTAANVGRRMREIGVRLALGASPRDVLRDVVGRGMTAPLAGMGVGLGASVLVPRLASDFLPTVSPADPVAYAVAAGVLLAAALVAALLPASRAARTDPVQNLRAE